MSEDNRPRRVTTAQRSLIDIPGLSKRDLEALEAIDITSLEQLAALARQQDVREHLADYLEHESVDILRTIGERAGGGPPESFGGRAGATPQEPPLTFGALPPTPVMRAVSMSLPIGPSAVVPLPSSVNLIANMPPVRDQGSRGSCVAFALSALHEYAVRANPQDYSERHLYFGAKQIDGAPSMCGTWQRVATGILASKGQCRELTWGYNPTAACNDHGVPPSAADSDAAGHRLACRALNPIDVVGIKGELAARNPVTISIPVFNSWVGSQATKGTGRITMRVGQEPEAGGHAMLLVGYQDDPPRSSPTPGGGWFIVRNSWGPTRWGSACPYGAGYGTIPYAYIAQLNWEAYTLSANQG